MIKVGPSGKVAHYFLNNRLTLLFIITALLAGVFAVMMTPREEEPQIQVPMVDLFLPMPGASPQELEEMSREYEKAGAGWGFRARKAPRRSGKCPATACSTRC